jgi:hypothetical protein
VKPVVARVRIREPEFRETRLGAEGPREADNVREAVPPDVRLEELEVPRRRLEREHEPARARQLGQLTCELADVRTAIDDCHPRLYTVAEERGLARFPTRSGGQRRRDPLVALVQEQACERRLNLNRASEIRERRHVLRRCRRQECAALHARERPSLSRLSTRRA